MNKIGKIIIAICVIIFVGVLIYKIGKESSPGSYPYAERFELEISEQDFIRRVETFKKNNSSYRLPDIAQLRDGRRDSTDYWYHVYFYYSNENQIVKTWIRPTGGKTIVFAFVGINEGLDLGHWKLINKDFPEQENQVQLEKFKEKILNKLEIK